MSEQQHRVLSCIQPTGAMHIGNYFGAIANWVELQAQYECIYGVVDYHAMTAPYDPRELKANSEGLIVDMMACGLDPDRCIMFLQSLVPEHTELCWIFNCVTSYGDLTRMTQFKDKANSIEQQGGGTVSGGLFTYPVLQAADILIYRADRVPIGKDQEQHLELAREIARNFNAQFGEYFPEPQPLFTPSLKIASLADPEKKMSKSLGDRHYISLFATDEEIRKKVKGAVTDTGLTPGDQMSPGVANLFTILRACNKNREADSLTEDHRRGQLKYVHLKEAVISALMELSAQLTAKRDALQKDLPTVWRRIREGSQRAREIARQTIKEVRSLVGLPDRGY